MDLKLIHPNTGQSLWLDYIRRNMLDNGDFTRWVEGGVRGVTTNPAIFEKAIGGSEDYTVALKALSAKPGATAASIYEDLAVEDIQRAADILYPLYQSSDRLDGYISMEVSPLLAHDGPGSVAEALRLHKKVSRENLMIKVPATPEGIPAVRQLLSQGLNVNITLLFSRAACRQVGEAYMDGLEAFAAAGGDLSKVASVASLFVSRLDVLAAQLLAGQPALADLNGKVALANAKLAYQDWKELFHSSRWQALAAKGARVQRLLWASTGVKDPQLSDVHYVEALIGPDTVDTVPLETLEAFRDHGKEAIRIEDDLEGAKRTLIQLADTGLKLDELTDRLMSEGVEKFKEAFDKLMASIEKRR